MFISNFNTELQPKSNKRLVYSLSTLLITALIYVVGWHESPSEVQLPQSIPEERPFYIDTNSNFTPALKPQKDCTGLEAGYELLGVVFDKESVLALVQVIASETIVLINKEEVGEIRLNSAELSKASFQFNECHFTLFLN